MHGAALHNTYFSLQVDLAEKVHDMHFYQRIVCFPDVDMQYSACGVWEDVDIAGIKGCFANPDLLFGGE